MLIRASAPVRIDFAGAWTDCPPFSDSFGGATLNAAINLYVRGELRSREQPGEWQPGRTQEPGIAVSYSSDIPAGSGLGSSAALNVVWLALARRTPLANLEDRMHLAESAFRIEKVLGIIGGRQDQYASAVGGINLFRFEAEGTRREAVKLNAATREELCSHLLLCYTGKSRLSSSIHANVWGAFRTGKREVVGALLRMRESALEAKEALEKWNPQRFGALLSEQSACSKALDPSTSNQVMEDLAGQAQPYVWGLKPCGAGGGGCMLFLAKGKEEKEALTRVFAQAGVSPIPFEFDLTGLTLETL